MKHTTKMILDMTPYKISIFAQTIALLNLLPSQKAEVKSDTTVEKLIVKTVI